MKLMYIFPGVALLAGVIGLSFTINRNVADEKTDSTLPAGDRLEVPRIDFVEMLVPQPHEQDPSVIWYDDFSSARQYMGLKGEIDNAVDFGLKGGSMDAGFNKGDVTGRGNRQVAFGDFPGNVKKVKDGEKFDDIYWRIYVKHEYGWEGAPAKMSRATSITSTNWQQAMIAHVWSGPANSITLDPASGVDGQTDAIKTTKYNDFGNLTWLGNRPASDFQLTDTEESGYWVLVESRAKLNTPGKSDGINQLWIDGRLEVERTNLNFRGNYTAHGINAVFLESYWNKGAHRTQGRWFDNFVVSTEPIGPVVCPANPTLFKTPYSGPGKLAEWEVELASDANGNNIVYKSNKLKRKEQVVVNKKSGRFLGPLAGKSSLASGEIYYCRVRQKSSDGEWSAWSRWHQGFAVK